LWGGLGDWISIIWFAGGAPPPPARVGPTPTRCQRLAALGAAD
jgi:hypothetical protein